MALIFTQTYYSKWLLNGSAEAAVCYLTAVAQGSDHIDAGEKVEVVKMDGIILTVARPEERNQAIEEPP
jgi:membrane-bound ClpP family serine protease